MRYLLGIIGMFATATLARADGNPHKGPCADVAACTRACSKSAAACVWGGHLLERSGLDTGTAKAAALYEKACTKGDAEGCWQAGRLADRGDGATADDLKRARVFFDRACSRRLLRGCMTLAKFPGADAKLQRSGVQRAIAIVKAACLKKDAEACDKAVELHTSWLETPDEKAATLYRDKACRIRTGAPCDPATSPAACQSKAATAQAAEATAKAANQQRFTAELAAQKLVPVTLVPHSWRENGIGPSDRPNNWRLDQIATVKIANRKLQLIVGHDAWGHCNRNAVGDEYVQRGDKIYRVQRAPRTTSTQSFTLCGCGPMCGGATPAVEHVGYEVPAGASFAGALDVAYDVDDVKLSYTDFGKCAPPP